MKTGVSLLRTVAKRGAEAFLARLPESSSSQGDLILAYHNVVPDDAPCFGDVSLHVRRSDLLAQIDVLMADRKLVPLMEILTTPRERGELRAAITFDDAYIGALTVGAEACEDRQIPFSVFIAPGLLGTVPPWDLAAIAGEWQSEDRAAFLWDRSGDALAEQEKSHNSAALAHEWCRIGTPDDLDRCAAMASVTFGNHTWGHVNCAAVTPERISAELTATHNWLNTHFKANAIPVLAYPYGEAPADEESLWRVAEHCEFALCVTGGHFDSLSNKLTIPRLNIPRQLSVNGFRARTRGRLRKD